MITTQSALVLLVEDDPDDEDLTIRAFRNNKFPGKVDVARNGQEALDYFFAADGSLKIPPDSVPDLILLDLKLPFVDGFEVLARLRDHDATRHLPIVIFSSSREEPDISRAYSLGANSYIHKPLEYDEFTEAVRQLGLYWLSLNQKHP